jgi:hypothetical protein
VSCCLSYIFHFCRCYSSSVSCFNDRIFTAVFRGLFYWIL